MSDQGQIAKVLELLQAEKADQEECITRDSKARSVLRERYVVEKTRNAFLEQRLDQFEKKYQLKVNERISSEELFESGSLLSDSQHELPAETLSRLSAVLQRYGNFMWFIQSDPKYLKQILSTIKTKDLDHFVSTIVDTVYANPYSTQEETQLLHLINSVVRSLWEKCTDITTFLRENSAAPKLLSAYTRREPCANVLQQVIQPPLKALYEEKKLNLEINPTKILEKMLISGKADPKHSVNSPEIQQIVHERVEKLKACCDSFLSVIYEAELPMGMRLICRELKDLAESKEVEAKTVPRDEEEDPSNLFIDGHSIADSLIGGFVFLRYFNPALVNPRTADPTGKVNPTANSRRNTILIAKILQNLSNGVVFGDKEKYMTPLNDYIIEQAAKLKAYFRRITDVDPLKEFARKDQALEDLTPTEPLIHLSLQDLTDLHTHVMKIEVPQSDPLSNVLQSLDEFKGLQFCQTQDTSKFVTLRVVDWMGDTDKPVQESDRARLLQASLLPVLRSIVHTSDLDLSSAVTSFNGSPLDDLMTLLTHASSFAKDTSNNALSSQVEMILTKVKSDNAASEAAFKKAVVGISEVITARQQLQVKLATEVAQLKSALDRVARHETELKERLKEYKAFLKTIEDQTYLKKNKKSKGHANQDEAKQLRISQITDVLSTDGLIGGLLSKVQNDVSRELNTALEKGSMEAVFPSSAEASKLFPRPCKFYYVSMSTFSTIGKSCLQSIVSFVLDTLPSRHEVEGNAESKTDERSFNWMGFFDIVSKLDKSVAEHEDAIECIIELMAIDIIVSILQHYDHDESRSEGVIPAAMAKTLIKIATYHFKNSSKPPRKKGLAKATHSTIRKEIANKWAVALSQLCPYYTTDINNAFVIAMKFFLGSDMKDPVVTEQYLRGFRFMRFDLAAPAGLKAFDEYITVQYDLIIALQNNTSSKLVTLQNLQFINLEHILRFADMTELKKDDGSQLTEVFYSKIAPMYDELLVRYKNDDMKVSILNACNTILLHGPDDFLELHVGTYAQTILTKGVDRKKSGANSRIERLGCVLHFLRGGQATFTHPGIAFCNGEPINRHSQVYGFAHRHLPDKILDIIFKKLFLKKLIARVPEVGRVVERIIVQMAFHDFNYTTNTVLKYLFDASSKDQEQLIGLRALEILTDTRSGFKEFTLSSRKVTAERNRLANTIESITSNILPTVLTLVKASDNLVGLRAIRLLNSVEKPDPLPQAGLLPEEDQKLDEWIILDLYDTSKEHIEFEESLFRTYGQKAFQLGVYYHSLRLFPEIMPEEMIFKGKDHENSTIDGLFVGKLIAHQSEIIARAAYQGLRRTMVSRLYVEERPQVIESFLYLFWDSAFQSTPAIGTFLHHLNQLIKLWCKVVVADSVQRFAGSRSSIHPSVLKSMIDTDEKCKSPTHQKLEPPAYLRWRARADAVGLVYLCHPDPQVREAAFQLVIQVQNIYSTWYTIQTGQEPPRPSFDDPSTIRCVADVISLYQEDILRIGTFQFMNASRASEAESDALSDPMAANLFGGGDRLGGGGKYSRKFISFPPLAAHCVSVLARICVDFVSASTITIAKELLRLRIAELKAKIGPIPLGPSDETHVSASVKAKWTYWHAVYFSLFGVVQSKASPHTRSHSSTLLLTTPEHSVSASAVSTRSDLSAVSTMTIRRRKPMNAASTSAIGKELASYLTEYWECLGSGVAWIKESVFTACSEVHAESAAALVQSLLASYGELQKKRRKKALTLIAIILHRLPSSLEFTWALRCSGKELVTEFRNFITETQAQLWVPKKLAKEKWSDTQVDLVLVASSFCRALCNLGIEDEDNSAKVFTDTGAIHEHLWPLKERYDLFKWLIKFTKEEAEKASLARANSSLSAEQKDAATERERLVTQTCANALRNLAGLGQIVPDADISSVLLKNDLLSWILRIQQGDYLNLSLLLCFHYKFLLPVYIDRIYQQQTHASDTYFRAIAEVFSSGDRGRLTNIRVSNQILSSLGYRRLQLWTADDEFKSLSRAKLAKLVHLSLLQMTHENVHTRFLAYEMIRSVTTQFISSDLGFELLQYRFAFESPIESWARETALTVSESLAKERPQLAFQMFSEAFLCLKSTKRQQDWITSFMLPWAASIQLAPMSAQQAGHAEEKKEKDEMPRFGAVQFPLMTPTATNVHKSQHFLVQLFNITVTNVVPFKELLPIWNILGSSRQNVEAILQFLVSNMTESADSPILLCKNIIFTIYEKADNRDTIFFLITKYFLRVLWQNARMWSKDSLQVRLKSSRILSALERYDDVGSEKTQEEDTHEFEEDVEDGYEAINAKKKSVMKKGKSIFAAREEDSRNRNPTQIGEHLMDPRLKKDKVSEEKKQAEQFQSHILAAMLVELIGKDQAPALPYYPIIVIYCIIFINDTNKFVRNTMHQLLIRLSNSITDGTSEESMSQSQAGMKHQTRFGGPLLEEALHSESLQLIWDKNEHSKVHADQKHVIMFAESFIAQYCDYLESRREHSSARIGYEALRWAVLSTDLNISNMAYIVYRALLSPLNEASIYALLLSLRGALENWERQAWYSDSTDKIPSFLTGVKREAMMIIDTVLAVSERLLMSGDLYRHPSILWTAVALLRVDDKSIYDRALSLLGCIDGFPYLFDTSGLSSPETRGRDDSSLFSRSVMSLGRTASQEISVIPEEGETDRYMMPEDFWSYSEKWSPSFEGIQPYILQGLTSEDTLETSVKLMSMLMRVMWDPIVDSLPTRHLMTITALLPPIYLNMIGASAVTLPVADLLSDLGKVISRFSSSLKMSFEAFHHSWVTLKDRTKRAHQSVGFRDPAFGTLANNFLEKICTQLADAYFPHYANPCTEYLTALLKSDAVAYHPVVLKITQIFLRHEKAHTFVDAFTEIITAAHQSVAIVGKDTAAKPVVGAGVGKQASLVIDEFAGPAADVIATVIHLFNHKHEEKDTEQHHGSFRALPLRNLRNSIAALTHVIHCAPMFPDS